MNFCSDNVSGIHRRILDALIAGNDGDVMPYGADSYARGSMLSRGFRVRARGGHGRNGYGVQRPGAEPHGFADISDLLPFGRASSKQRGRGSADVHRRRQDRRHRWPKRSDRPGRSRPRASRLRSNAHALQPGGRQCNAGERVGHRLQPATSPRDFQRMPAPWLAHAHGWRALRQWKRGAFSSTAVGRVSSDWSLATLPSQRMSLPLSPRPPKGA